MFKNKWSYKLVVIQVTDMLIYLSEYFNHSYTFMVYGTYCPMILINFFPLKCSPEFPEHESLFKIEQHLGVKMKKFYA